MLSPEQIEHLFTYHPPTPEQVTKYETIKAAVAEVNEVIDTLRRLVPGLKADENASDYLKCYQAINASTKALVAVLCELCPPSADLAAAVRCVRLVRNACNEQVVWVARGSVPGFLVIARHELIKARWQANSAIALEK